MQQEAELDLRRLLEREPDGAGELHPVGGDALGMLAGIRIARLDGVRQRAHGRAVGAAQLLRARALLLEHLAQIGGVALELALARGGLLLGALAGVHAAVGTVSSPVPALNSSPSGPANARISLLRLKRSAMPDLAVIYRCRYA